MYPQIDHCLGFSNIYLYLDGDMYKYISKLTII